jgi:hypothetical protein
MKKLITVVTLLLAFSINATAQEKKAVTKEVTEQLSPEIAAKKDAGELTEFLGLTETQNTDFARLFEMKHTTLQDKSLSQERKTEMSRIVDLKLRASLEEDQIKKLEENPTLLKKLVN